MKRKKPQKAAAKPAKKAAAKPAKKPAKPAPKAAKKAPKPAPKAKAAKPAKKAPAKKAPAKKAPAKKAAPAKRAAPAKKVAAKTAAKKAPAKAAAKKAPAKPAGRLAGAGKAAAKLVKDTRKAAGKLAGKAQKTVAKAQKAVKDTAKAGQKAASNLVKQAKALPAKAAKAVKAAATKAQKAGAKTPAAKNVAKAAAIAAGAAAAVGAAATLAGEDVKEKARELGKKAKELVEKATETITSVAAEALKKAEPAAEAAPEAPADLSNLSRKARKRALKREQKARETPDKDDESDEEETEASAEESDEEDEESEESEDGEVVVEDDGEVVEEDDAEEESDEEEEKPKKAAASDDEDEEEDEDDDRGGGRDPWSETEDEESADDKRHRDDDDDDDPSFSGPSGRKGNGGQSSGGGAGSGPAGAPSSNTPSGRSAAGATSALAALSHDYWEHFLRSRPQLATYLGDRRYDDQMPDVGPAGRAADVAAHKDLKKRLARVSLSGATLEDRLTADALAETLQQGIEEPAQNLWQWEVDQLMGPQVWFLEILNTHPLASEQDYENLLSRMKAYPALIDQYLGNLREGVSAKRCSARIAVERVLKQLDELLVLEPSQNPLAEAVGRIPAGFADPVRDRLATAVLESVRAHINPSLERMRTYIRRDYAPHARAEVGCSALPDGLETYEFLVRKHTTTRLSAEDIHRIGLDEVASIRAEMETVLNGEGYTGDLRDVLEALRTDPKNLAPSREALLARYTADLERISPKLPAYFGRLPKAACIIKPLEEFREKDAPSAYYYGPAEDGSRPGIFYANTYKPETRLLFSTTALTAHEAVPGHHLQVALAMELEALPSFRRHGGFTAYVEGWALYAERLCDEMGLYPDALSRVGMLTAQGLRACRLVVDTGMHALGWTRDQAIEFMRANLAIRDVEIINEIDRYIVWPAQALAYKVGQREISRLRENAEGALGQRFDIRGFHSAVLEHGALPLTTLGLAIDDWIAGKR